MASFRKLPSGKWNVQVRIKGHKPRSATFETKAEAKTWAKEEALLVKDDQPSQDFYDLGERYCILGLEGKPTQYETRKELVRMP